MHARCMHARTLKAGWVRTMPRRTCEIRADMDGVVDAAPRVALEGEAAVQAADLHLCAPPPPRLPPAPRLLLHFVGYHGELCLLATFR